jgi:hypothetical protein
MDLPTLISLSSAVLVFIESIYLEEFLEICILYVSILDVMMM